MTKLKTPTQNIIDDEDEESNEPIVQEVSAEETISTESLSCQYGRNVIQEIIERSHEKIVLDLKDAAGKGHKRCILKGSWIDTKVNAGDIVNVLALSDDKDEIVIDDMNGLVVVNPDLLISGTSIVSTLFCMRKAVLNERFKEGGSSRSMLIGTLVHELVQESLKNGLRSKSDLAEQLEKCLQDNNIVKSLSMLKMTLEEMRKEVEPFLPHILFFIEKYVVGKINAQVPEPAYQVKPGTKPMIWSGQVETIKDIEENIWSPRLGIKGKVDLTVQVKLQNKDVKGRTCKTMPLELKTGRPSGSAEHRGQLILYSMMMSERRPDPESGLLLYLRTSSMMEVRAGIHEMRGLVQLRNQLASHLQDYENLPSPINAKRACRDCGHLTACAMYQKLSENTPQPPHAMAELVPEVLNHLTQEDRDFFDKWSKMNSLELGEARKGSKLKSLWCMTPQQREFRGQAICDLVIVDSEEGLFKKSNNEGISGCIFQTGDMVILSSESGELALAQGTVMKIGHDYVKVNLDKKVNNKNARYVLDRYEYVQSGGNWLTLAKLMSNTEQASLLREAVIAKKPATFVTGLPKEVAIQGKHILRPLNSLQQKAIFKTMMAERFVLLKGMPGSGKTTMIVALVRLLVKLGKTVLLTSYTHSAVDNLLLKLLKSEEGSSSFLRLGRSGRVHNELKCYSEDYLIKENKVVNPQELDRLYRSKPVVAITCLGASNHPALNGQTFDYCIVDEAGQSMLMSALGPLFYAKKFVLVGDPEQLPPVVKSTEAKKMGMDVSLFSHLQDQDNTIPLSVQYRMNKDIQDVANHMTYSGLLECGNDLVKDRSVSLTMEWPSFVEKGAQNVSVAFFDTSALAHVQEALDELGISNVNEAEMVCRFAKLAQKMQNSEGGNCSTGIIAPFRAQVSTLRKLLSSFPSNDISTVDQFQGRDKDIIIYSCTRTKAKSSKESDDIMSDWRRLNVAVTRAKARLWMIGNSTALRTYEPFAKLLDYLSSKELIFSLY